MIDVRGRLLREPVHKVTHFSGRVCIRIDDARNPEYWVEVWLDDDELQKLAAQRTGVHAAAAQVASELAATGGKIDGAPVIDDGTPFLFENPPGACPRCGAALSKDRRGVLRCPLCSVPRA